MSYDFNANDIFEMAEQMERNGAQYYRDAAKNATDNSAKQFLLDLAAMEDSHEKDFNAMKMDLSAKEKAQTIFDPENESVHYLRALTDTQVFFKKEIDITSMKEIFKAAIIAEKDSIIFYLGMKELVPEGLGKNKIDSIIKEEMGHIKILSEYLKKLK